ncbi:MFS transporter, partial [Pseudonocardia humida]
MAGVVAGRARWAVLALCAAQFVLIVDVVIVTVALPSIRRDLVIPDARLSLVGVAYTVTFGSLLIVLGRVGDVLGRRAVLLAGMVVFTLASAAAAAAQRDWHLFAARAAQGVGAAMVSANALASINARFAEGPARNRALGLWAAVGSAGAVAGQLIGGAVTELFGWRWIFLINLPIGLLVVAVLARTLPESRAERRGRIDVAGSALLAGGTALLVGALAAAADGTGVGPVVGLLVGAAAVLSVFALVERGRAEPVLRLGLLRLPGVRTANATLFLNAGALGAALFFTTLYLQVVLGYSALAVSAVFAPVTVAILVLSPRAAALTGRFGVRTLLAGGLTLLAAGALLLARVPVEGGLVDVLPSLALFALGSSMSYAPTFVAASSGVPDTEQGAAAGLINSTQELGSAVCLALLAWGGGGGPPRPPGAAQNPPPPPAVAPAP